MHEPFKYQGDELPLFEKATNWKEYFSKIIRPFITGRILECGPGIGATTKALNNGTYPEWILLEPDTEMASVLKKKIINRELPSNCKVVEGTISAIENNPQFDTILYVDVLEHIEDDKTELEHAVSRLNTNGTLIVLSPAFNSLHSKFDDAIGHYRRYSKKELKSLVTGPMKIVLLRYLDSSGFFISYANKILLKQKYPSEKQVHIWDKVVVPVSKISDRLFNYSFGKTILGIWQKR